MANFTNYSKLQLIVERTSLGTDEALGGEVTETITLSGLVATGSPFIKLGVTTALVVGDTASVAAGKIRVALGAAGLVGVVISGADDKVIITYGSTASNVPTEQGDLIVSDGVTYTYLYVDNRDTVTILKHSEYDDTESGLSLATVAMYTLVAASPVTDTTQLQRIMLNASSSDLLTTDITSKVTGKSYQAWSV